MEVSSLSCGIEVAAISGVAATAHEGELPGQAGGDGMYAMDKRIFGLILLTLCLWGTRADAACTGSGLVWNCSAGTTSSQVSSALSSAADGATLTFAAGSYSWNSFVNFSNSKGATLICASEGACNVSVSGTVLGMNGTLSGTNNHLYRVSGFVFNGGSAFVMWFYGPGTATNLRIDHNQFVNQSTETVLFFGENYTVGYFYGVIDHNTLTNSRSIALAQIIGSGNGAPPAGTRGTAKNLYFEDNTIAISSMTNAGVGCIDSWGGASIVWRHNKSTNCLVTSHGVTHGWGPVNWEVYANQIIVNSGTVRDCYRCFHHQGSGELLVFDNLFTAASGKSSDAISLTHYRSATPSAAGYDIAGRCDGSQSIDGNRSGMQGYPCKRQPGRDVNGALQPIYVWNNRWSDTGGLVAMDIENPWNASNPSVGTHVAANRDYFNAVSAGAQTSPTSPFNGTSGMGFGTLANRPTTCTTGSEAGGGVGYFATNQGPQGTLYRCSASNTWTVQYTPYTYPHPLTTGGTTTTPPPSAPSNVRIIR
jgi:hypothetical protein